jgi:hypothetical protein
MYGRKTKIYSKKYYSVQSTKGYGLKYLHERKSEMVEQEVSLISKNIYFKYT